MKVFFTSSITGLTKFRKNCELISKILRKHGHKVQDHFLKISKEQDEAKTEKESKYVFKYITDRIKEADVFIAEMSFRSAPVSYQLTYALDHNKPSLYLVEERKGNPAHAVFKGNPTKYLMIRNYTTKDLEETILHFLEHSKKLLMRRFNFLLPAELEEYLRISSAMDRVSKG